ncbi:MAG: hypothetical protein E7527_03200 [Ruminococcaceae bacterium]|nr:hypothetical protein [Oscillospiraceae bacterium]
MKKTKKLLSILLTCLMLMSLLSVGAFAAEGTQSNPIVISKTALGEVSYYFCNTEFAEGQTKGVWYTFIAEEEGIAQLDCTSYEGDFQATLWVNDAEYKYNDDGIISRPINSLPVNVGDEIVICIEPVAPYLHNYVYANIGFVTGEKDIQQLVKFKSAGGVLYIAAGAKLYCQDDSANGVYAQMGLQVSGDSVDGISVTSNNKIYTDSDLDGAVELKLGGSAGSAGVPPVKPLWVVENNSAEDKKLVLSVTTDTTHECEYDDDTDADCNVCGRIRAIEVLTFGGTSVSAEVNGLAIRVDANVAGMQINGKVAIYDNATVDGNKLITMGALACNNGAFPSLENVNNNRILNIPAQYLCKFDAATGAVSYSIRITDIPEQQKDTIIAFRPYYIYEDEQGDQQVAYGDIITASYNQAAPQ